MITRTGIGVTAAAIAVGGGFAVKRDETKAVDRAVRRRVHPRRSPRVTAVAKGISYLAQPHVHPAVAAVLGLLVRMDRGRGGYAPAAASLATLGFDNAMRLFVHQRRPPKAGPHHKRNRYAYPSGHTTAATAIGVAIAAEMDHDLGRGERILLWSAVGAVAVGVGWSRLYLDEHWLDDVVGGWMAGTVIGLAAGSLDARI
ncbi:MAG TPA: phosphatase PAP2 family protein [Gemmatimonadaceae bacterium]|jgi:undecaprenyl-diphosphatase